ncbi:MAG TPA: OmpA family protein [Minicystis sp.]|nr:OmpA family protein [Minicystis sp.]
MSDEHDDVPETPRPAGVPRRGWVAPILVGLALGAAAATGWYALRMRTQAQTAGSARDRAAADAAREQEHARTSDEQLAACKRERDEHATGHAETKRAADEAKAALDATQGELEQLRKQRAETEARLKAFQVVTARLQKMIDAGKLKVMVRDGRMIVKLPERILFPSGSAELAKGGVAAIREIASILRQFPDRRFMVAGHTDNIPAGGKYKTNWDLSTARAVVVTEQLVTGGMNPARLVAAGYGPYEPIASNGSEAGRAENRRIEIVLLPNVAEMPPLPASDGEPASTTVAASAKPARK